VAIGSGTDLEGLLEELNGQVGVAPFEMGLAQVNLEIRAVGLEVDGVLELLDGHVEFAFVLEEQTEFEMGLAQVGVFHEKVAEGFQGVLVIAHAREGTGRAGRAPRDGWDRGAGRRWSPAAPARTSFATDTAGPSDNAARLRLCSARRPVGVRFGALPALILELDQSPPESYVVVAGPELLGPMQGVVGLFQAARASWLHPR